jgi:hypothetical protein
LAYFYYDGEGFFVTVNYAEALRGIAPANVEIGGAALLALSR